VRVLCGMQLDVLLMFLACCKVILICFSTPAGSGVKVAVEASPISLSLLL
jgi:hypothetical protein